MSPALVIAEAGINMGQNLHTAFDLVDAAIDCGADVYKTQLEVNSQYTLNAEEIKKLSKYCTGRIPFVVTAFDRASLEFLLTEIPMPFIKIPSGMTEPDIFMVAERSGLPIVMSTGGMNINEIKLRLQPLRFCQVTLLHCVSAYPTPLEAVNLRAMQTLAQQCKRRVGISDHSANPLVPIAAVALGAEVVEVHFTLDDSMPGPDHKASLEPAKFKYMVQGIRQIEAALGSSVKQRQPCEMAFV